MKVIIVGGHGKVALRLASLLSVKQDYTVSSIIRNADQSQDIKETGATPVVLSLEDDDKSKFAEAFEGKDIVYFAAGAGGQGGEERTKKVDYEGALKICDAIEMIQAKEKPRLILVSAVDIRNPDIVPPHYNEEDIALSERMRKAIPAYVHWKYEADKDLVKRTAFKWIILRPGGLTLNPGIGKASIGKTHITTPISRDDVAHVLALLAERPDASGLAIDLVGGDDDIPIALDKMIKRGETDFLG